jgi:alpha-ketoglutarate-dependent taurine dioxygenase
MDMVVTPSTATLGAVVHGVELRALDDASWSAIEDAFHEHAVLVFPEQFLDDDEQSAFGRRFGRFERGMGYLGAATVWPISNVQADGSLADPM